VIVLVLAAGGGWFGMGSTSRVFVASQLQHTVHPASGVSSLGPVLSRVVQQTGLLQTRE
jgi:hypothetical protein